MFAIMRRSLKYLAILSIGAISVLTWSKRETEPPETRDLASFVRPFNGGVPGTIAGSDHQVGQNSTSTRTHEDNDPVKKFVGSAIRFETNRGQTDPSVRFLSRGPGYVCFFTDSEAVLSVAPSGSENATRPSHEQLRMRWIAAKPDSRPAGEYQLDGRAHYFNQTSSGERALSAETFEKIRYREVLPKTDLLLYGSHGNLEFDYILRPGATVAAVSFEIEGARSLVIDGDGVLQLALRDGHCSLSRPVIYQEIAGKRRFVSGRYALLDGNRVGFEVAAYDTSRELVIDPVLQYSSYFGGSLTEGQAGIALDGSGNIYVAGQTPSADFPTTSPLQATFAGGMRDAFVVKLNPSGSTVLYSTYLGGTGDDPAFGMTADSAGNAYIVGATSSGDYPLANAFQASFAGGYDVFLSKLSPDGSTLLFSTYLGGGGFDNTNSVHVSDTGKAWVAGMTSSADFPLLSPSQGSIGGGIDGFVAILDTTMSGAGALLSSTYYGGTGDEMGLGTTVSGEVAVDSSENVYIAGVTTSSDLTLLNPVQGALNGSQDTFVARFNASGTLTFATYLGGSDVDQCAALTVDNTGNIYLGGITNTADFPIVNAFQSTYGGGAADMYIAKIEPDGAGVLFASFLGGDQNEFAHALRLDASGNILLAGLTGSSNFPTANPTQAANGGGGDAIVARIPSSGAAPDFATYLGGAGDEQAIGIALTSGGEVLVSGITTSDDFPTVNAVQNTRAGGQDIFIARLSLTGGTTPTPGTEARAVLSVSNNLGTAPLTVNLDGSQSTGGSGQSIASYLWDFGDGTGTTSASATVTHTYTMAGEYVPTLQVQNTAGETSEKDHAAVVVGDGQVGDAQLFLSKAAFKLDRSKDDNDSITLDGFLNPAGFPADLSGAGLILRVNGEVLSATVPVEGRSRTSSRSAGRKKTGYQGFILLGTGKFKITGSGVDLSTSVTNVADEDGKDVAVQTNVSLELTGVTVDTPAATGVIESRFKSKQGRNASGKFSYIKLPTFTGIFKSLKTSAKERDPGEFRVTAGGPIAAEFNGSLAPTGTITVTIGGDGSPSSGAEFSIPVTSLKQSGAGAQTTSTYSKKLGEVPGLKKFQINGKKRKWTVSTENLAGTGIPATGTGITSFKLRLELVLPTSAGIQTFTTTVEIKRSSDASGTWKR